MPHLLAPEARHRWTAERTIDPFGFDGQIIPGQRTIIGVLYDRNRVPAAQLEAEFSEKVDATKRQAYMRPDRNWKPWEAVAQLMAAHPGDVLPNPALDVPVRLKAPWWIPSEEERRQAAAKDKRRSEVGR